MKLPKQWFAILFGFALLLFTGYLLLDTFLIPHVYTVVSTEATAEPATEPKTETSERITIAANADANETVVFTGSDTEAETAAPAQETPAPETVVTDTSYSDGNISVTLTTYRYLDTDVYVADVKLSDADYLKTAFAENTYGRNITQKTSTMADSVDAILAINGDYYGAQRSGYVIRNGVLYRDTSSGSEDLVIYQDGSFGIVNESEITAQALLDAGAWNVLSFGPALVTDGGVAVDANDEVGRAMASNPRTAIGIIDDLHYVFVVSDGRTSSNDGLSLYELAAFMQSLGCETAYNLDGGGSSSMVFMDTLINNPVNGRRSSERSVSDIVYIGY